LGSSIAGSGGRVAASMTVTVAAIGEQDIVRVSQFLSVELNARIPAEVWVTALRVPWKVDAPNHGFLLQDGERLVGVYLAFYSERDIAGRRELFCNLGAWCVLPDYRFHSVRLLKALLAQEGYHFTDLSPSGSVVPLNKRLKFRSLDTSTALIPNLPWPTWPGRIGISTDAVTIEAALSGPELTVYRDHAEAPAVRHILVSRGGRSCHVMVRRDRRKNLPLFASVLYVSDPELFRRCIGPISRHLLLRHGVLATLVEIRVAGGRPPRSRMLPAGRPKMFRSSTLEAALIDNLYSELTCVPW
jgi:hypothetical protein